MEVEPKGKAAWADIALFVRREVRQVKYRN